MFLVGQLVISQQHWGPVSEEAVRGDDGHLLGPLPQSGSVLW